MTRTKWSSGSNRPRWARGISACYGPPARSRTSLLALIEAEREPPDEYWTCPVSRDDKRVNLVTNITKTSFLVKTTSGSATVTWRAIGT
jgi:hypothetical protein